jgi:probable rRNA maturation factor
MGTLEVELTDATRRLTPAQVTWLATNIEAAARTLHAMGSIRVRVIDDEEMARAHEEFAGVPGTTDVLTFDLSDSDIKPPRPAQLSDLCELFGFDTDILVCLDESLRVASARGYPFERELLLYVVHGLLHCMGLDDHEQSDSRAMHTLEDEVLVAIGVGAVFRRPGAGDEA